ncbi:MAG: hypothetical protein J3K34DRAFT_511964 [Monoraphidium minutum]|nr:MAG: hypothetical protein J3K34DRAFT_511964 [Monoraphidium minutum]
MAPKKAGRGSERPNKKARPTSVEDVVAAGKPRPAAPAGAKPGRNTLTVQEIEKDRITQLAAKHWSAAALAAAAAAGKPPPPFDAALVEKLYKSELGGGAEGRPPPVKRVMLLEVSQYLENWLWPHFDASGASAAHVMSIVAMVNQKFREGVPAWTCFHTREDAFSGFFRRVLELRAPEPLAALSQHERTAYVLFFTNVFASLEDEMVRGQALRLVSLPLWHALGPGRLQLELHAQPALAKRWKALLKKDAKAAKEAAKGGEGGGGGGEYVPAARRPEATFLPGLVDELLASLAAADDALAAAEAARAGGAAPMEVEGEGAAAADGEAAGEGEEDEEDDSSSSSDEEEEAAAAAGEEGAAAGGAEAQPPQQQGKQQQGKPPQANGGGAGKKGGRKPRPPRAPRLGPSRGLLLHVERCIELVIDLLSQLPTRRFVHALLEDRALALLDLATFYLDFPIDDHSGEPLREDDVLARHYDKVTQLQRLFFRHWPELRDLALSNCAATDGRDALRRGLGELDDAALARLVCGQLRLAREDDAWAGRRDFLEEVVVAAYERRRSQRAAINAMPLYPSEAVLWDEAQARVPSDHYSGDAPLALPKLNLQFLTAHDYLLRNFHLFRLEAAYEVREDIKDALQRLGPGRDEEGATVFRGWSRMALPLSAFRITEVARPKVGELRPATVTAELVIDTRGLRGDIASEWDNLRQHDVIFLVGVEPPDAGEAGAFQQQQQQRGGGRGGRGGGRGGRGGGGNASAVLKQLGLVAVRGAEVIEVRDEAGNLMNDFTGRVRMDERKPPSGTVRTLSLALDPAQYQLDVNAAAAAGGGGGGGDVYARLNAVLRRDAKENNFKAVLESIRDLLNEDASIPPWLRDIFLGYGDPGAAHYSAMPDTLPTVDFKDTFLDFDHLKESFPQYTIELKGAPKGPAPGKAAAKGKAAKGAPKAGDGDAAAPPAPPYRLTFPPAPAAAPGSTRTGAASKEAADVAGGAAEGGEGGKAVLVVEPYVAENPGPYPQDQPKTNSVRFTPVQVEAIRSGVQPGLTMVVGPPGTGKTDTAVQVMTIADRDVPSRYLLRLGMGERDLDVDDDFSRTGRVNAMLARRLLLLAEVERLARSLGVPEEAGAGYTCETAGYFWLLHVLSRWEKYTAALEGRPGDAGAVGELFPFAGFFADAPQPIFKGSDREEDMEAARGCWRHLRTLFQELEECRAFELLKGTGDRVNYLSTCQAKVVAMTCTHAALKRREFLNLAFKYDNLVMEEAAQILEVETFIPMVLQATQDGVARLKRVIMIGDHHQLPPVVQNMAFQKYSRLDQSLFARFIRLGTPYVELDAQGRARPSIAALYNWRYRALGDLPRVKQSPEFLAANAGLAYEYQLVDVPDFMGRGESEPRPYYYQNLGEAEYLVSLYCFMRLLGYPASRISILTTYNGQKDLLRDVIERRCAYHPAFGRPHKVTTVDKYQGQQNDYVLLSLVRTKLVGHFRDVRRLVVALSRARLGLYVFGRAELFANCYELRPAFARLLERPTQLALVKGESYGACGRQLGEPAAPTIIPGLGEMAELIARMAAEQDAARAAAAAAAAAAVPPPRPPPGSPPRGAAGGEQQQEGGGSGAAEEQQQQEPGDGGEEGQQQQAGGAE